MSGLPHEVVTRESAEPPTRRTVFQMPTAAVPAGWLAGEAVLIWRRMAPGSGAETVTRRSVSWAVPVSPGRPRRRMGCGEEAEEKKVPAPEMVEKTSPTRMEPGGTWMVVFVR